MSTPYRIDDGNFQVAQQNGLATVSHPFSDKGDNRTFVYRRPMRVDAEYYVPPSTMTQRQFKLGLAYLVDIEEVNFAGDGLVQYNEVYACVPSSRIEYGSTSYSLEIIQVVNNEQRKVGEYTGICDGLYRYDYSLGAPLPQLYRAYRDDATGLFINGSGSTGLASSLAVVNPSTAIGRLFARRGISSGGSGNPSIYGRRLVDNSTSKTWMGMIYERISIYAAVPPFQLRAPVA